MNPTDATHTEIDATGDALRAGMRSSDTPQDRRPDRTAVAARLQRRRRRIWPWLLGALAVLAGLALLAAALGATALVNAIDPDALRGLDITVNGQGWNPALHGAPGFAAVLAVAGGLFVAMLAVLLVVLVIVPSVLLLVLGVGALAIGSVLLALLLAAALALSPLWLVLLIVWLAVRRKPALSASGKPGGLAASAAGVAA